VSGIGEWWEAGQDPPVAARISPKDELQSIKLKDLSQGDTKDTWDWN
jgi:hypothetical protein